MSTICREKMDPFFECINIDNCCRKYKILKMACRKYTFPLEIQM